MAAEQEKIIELSSKVGKASIKTGWSVTLIHNFLQCYKDQAVWFLNAFWDRYEGEAERLWVRIIISKPGACIVDLTAVQNWVHKLAELDLDKGAEGNEVGKNVH